MGDGLGDGAFSALREAEISLQHLAGPLQVLLVDGLVQAVLSDQPVQIALPLRDIRHIQGHALVGREELEHAEDQQGNAEEENRQDEEPANHITIQ